MIKKKVAFFNLGSGVDPNKAGKSKSTVKKIGCAACSLYEHCNTEIEPIGEGKKGILIIGESPTMSEVKVQQVFPKSSRALISKLLDEINLDLDRDCYRVHAIRCCAGKGVKVNNQDVEHCRFKLLQYIEKVNPRIIIPMGTLALKALIGHRISGRLSGTELHHFFGEYIPDQEIGKWICPTYSPMRLLKEKMWFKGNEVPDPVKMRQFDSSLKNACKKDVFYHHNYAKEVTVIKDPETAIHFMSEELKAQRDIAFDYETNSLKPHQEGRAVKMASFSNSMMSYAFPYFDDNEEFQRVWYRLMLSKNVGKIAHKMDFENTWTRYRAGGKYVRNWSWDTCLAAHCINSHKPKGLKFWTYTKLGILGYDEAADKYLKSSKKDKKERGGNALNRIDKMDLDEGLLYNGIDSHVSKKLEEIQRTTLTTRGNKFLKGYKFFLQGAETLSKVQNEGMLVNMKSLAKNEKILTRKIDNLLEDLKAYKEWKAYPKGVFNPGSDTQLSRLLYETLGYDKPAKGESQTDEEQLKRIGTPFTGDLVSYRKFLKMRDTYIGQFKREQVNGVIRPFFNLHIPKTFRSSSDSPNFQNMPARDPQAMKYVMSNIVPRLGNKLAEWDYKGVEVTISACYHKDPNMISYLIDGGDMHSDTTADAYACKPEDVTKSERQFGKGDIVFPSFYGSGVPKIAPNLWEHTTPERKIALDNQGIRNYKDFYRHMEEVMRIFWDERFPVYKEWKQKVWHDYLKKGYTDLLTGFRYYGPASYTQITNVRIQGSAFHVLLWSLNNIYPEVKKKMEKSLIIGQIHDAVVGDIHPTEESEIDSIIKKWGTKKVREHWDWISLPLSLEKESTEVNGTWDTMQGRGFI